MSVKELKSYEFQCDVCKAHKLEPKNRLPEGWYELDILVMHNPNTPLYADDCKYEYVNLREKRKVIHVCDDCAVDRVKDIFIKPTEMFNDEVI